MYFPSIIIVSFMYDIYFREKKEQKIYFSTEKCNGAFTQKFLLVINIFIYNYKCVLRVIIYNVVE